MTLVTLAAPARFVLETKKSRFLAQAIPVESAEQALAWLHEIADPDATHNCWAYRIGTAYRFSDDAEPGGTAGRPILAAIDNQGFDRVMAVVTRWYGGINLGAGGLARAYGGSTAECLRSAPRRPLLEMMEAELHCDFALVNSVHSLLPDFAAEKLGERFDEQGLRLRLRLPASMFAGLAQRLRDLSRGAAFLEAIESPGE